MAVKVRFNRLYVSDAIMLCLSHTYPFSVPRALYRQIVFFIKHNHFYKHPD